MSEARSAAEAGVPPSELLELIYDRTGYLKELQESPDLQEQGRAENLEELVSVAREFEDRAVEGGGTALADFLEQVSLVADTDDIPDEAGGVVTLMTCTPRKAWSSRWFSSPAWRTGSSPTSAPWPIPPSWPRSAGSPTSA